MTATVVAPPASIPYTRLELPDADLVAADVAEIIRSGQLTKGHRVAQYEQALATRLGVRHVIATASCTTGLMALFRALGLDGPVIVPSFTFMATAHAVVWAGGTPVFADVDERTFTLDPASVEAALTPETRAIVGVPVFGTPCDVEGLQAVADGAGIPLLFDSAHGVGSFIHGAALGGNGVAEVFSTTPTKTLVTGEGGFVATDHDGLAGSLRRIIEYGNDGSYDSTTPGLNGRLSEVHAAIGLRALAELDRIFAHRQLVVACYRQLLAGLPGIRIQEVPPGCASSYKDFTIVIEDDFGPDRDETARRLEAEVIETRKYYYPAVHRQRPYAAHPPTVPLPVTERLEGRVLSLPIGPGITECEAVRVVEALARAHA